jgi:hypothetical protein
MASLKQRVAKILATMLARGSRVQPQQPQEQPAFEMVRFTHFGRLSRYDDYENDAPNFGTIRPKSRWIEIGIHRRRPGRHGNQKACHKQPRRGRCRPVIKG